MGWVVERVDEAASSIVVVVGYASPNKEQGNACNLSLCLYTLKLHLHIKGYLDLVHADRLQS